MFVFPPGAISDSHQWDPRIAESREALQSVQGVPQQNLGDGCRQAGDCHRTVAGV